MLKMNEKLICCIIAAILLFMGMCQDIAETDSSFLCTDLEYANTAISSVDCITESADSCTSEMIGKNNSMWSLHGEFVRNVIRWDKSVLLSMIAGALLQYLLYFYSIINGQCYEILHSGTVAVNYIHHKDGEK